MAAKDIPVVVLLQDVTTSGTGAARSSALTVPRDGSGTFYKIKAYPGAGCTFDGWTVTRLSDHWGGPDAELFSEDGDTLTILAPFTDSNDTDDVTISVDAAFTYGGDEPDDREKVHVTVVSSGNGGGVVFGSGTYAAGVSYTVGGTPGDDPLSAVKRITSTLGDDQSFAGGTGGTDGTQTVTATATQDVTWTVEFARAHRVAVAVASIDGGPYAALLANCTVSATGHVRTREATVNGVTRTEYLFLDDAYGTISASPSAGARAVGFFVSGESGGMTSGNSRWEGHVYADFEFAAYCYWLSARLSATVRTDGLLDGSGGSVTFSPPSAQSYDSVTLTAEPASGYKAGKSVSDGLVFSVRETPDDEAVTTFDASPATVRVKGKSLRDIAGKSGFPDWVRMGDNAAVQSPYVYFRQPEYTLVEAYFHKLKLFRVYFDFMSYAGQGVVTDGAGNPVSDGQEFEVSKTALTLRFGADDPGFFLYMVLRWKGFFWYPDFAYGGGSQAQSRSVTILSQDQVDGASFRFRAWIWPVTTGAVLYSPTSGAILHGDGGAPLAQFVSR